MSINAVKIHQVSQLLRNGSKQLIITKEQSFQILNLPIEGGTGPVSLFSCSCNRFKEFKFPSSSGIQSERLFVLTWKNLSWPREPMEALELNRKDLFSGL